MTKIYIDENLPPQIAEALNILETHANEGFEVLAIGKEFGRGAQDEDWIPKVGAEQGVVITSDYNIQRIRRQRELFQEHGVGIFFFNPPSKTGYTYWEQVEQIVKRWREIKKKCRNKRPFAFRCNSKSTEFEGM
ncbi:hypothetical protein J2I47_15220 [Fibrella sp. HMF5335]|uniref:VapC45 PIN like domain-containing protein n=1 Tax=Fibrella rubiginis TaxID=2817060 RepID=A0A939GK30_9BACT|nr:hypothetical protein [Fibrella rubiginis]MBO0937907.1 hypothetical protein [Fibrella rubiginis]